ncbi:unnamed protein product [Porites evermanni]|uniref:BTB domain-containing protein n=1 Tax=Porites evermanni TaxID=104178 RepID=A0ABN8QKG9_9CNID|nr:unnamed protein product [Porites evermanni]
MAVIVSPLDAPVETKIGEAEETTYFFNKNEHAKRLLENLAEMQVNGLLTDVVVRTGSKDYETNFHCMLLAACSQVVKKRLVENEERSIVLQEMSQKKLEFFKGFIYRSNVILDKGIIDDLHNFAVKYGIDDLQAICEKYKHIRDEPSHQLEIAFDDQEEVLLELFSMFLEKNFTTTVLEDEKGQTQIEVHGQLIAAASPMLEEHLEDSSARDNDKLRLNISSDALAEFVDYIYCAKVTLRRQNVLDLLQVACNYELPALAKVCCEWVAARLDSFDVVRTLWWAKELDSVYTEDLENPAKSYIVANFSELTTGQEFNLLVYEDLKEIIQDDKLSIEREEDVYAVVMKWIEYDRDSRSPYLCDLLTCVRLEVTSREFLAELEDDQHIRRCSECFQLLGEARQKLAADGDERRPALGEYKDDYEKEVDQDAFSDDASLSQFSDDETLKDYESLPEEYLPQDSLPQSREPREMRLRKDGRPDMRLKENRRFYLAKGTNKNGNPDRRIGENRETVLMSSRNGKEMWPDRNESVIDDASSVSSSEEKISDFSDDMSSVSSPFYRGPFPQDCLRDSEVTRKHRLRKDGQPDMRCKENRKMYLEDGINKNGKPDRRLRENSIEVPGPLKKDGTPDMRYKVNKDFFGRKERKPESPHTPSNFQRATGQLRKNGAQDKGNRGALESSCARAISFQLPSTPSGFAGPVKKDGTPDMRYNVNKQLYSACSATRSIQKSSPCGPLQKNGTPDMRYAANKQAHSRAPLSSGACGPLKKDGTPDMRFKANRR